MNITWQTRRFRSRDVVAALAHPTSIIERCSVKLAVYIHLLRVPAAVPGRISQSTHSHYCRHAVKCKSSTLYWPKSNLVYRYMEAIPLLYLDKTFRFSTPSAFVSFAASILPKRFALISRVVIDLDLTSSDEELSGLLRYQDLPDELPVLNQLPLIEPGGMENCWILSCRIAKNLGNLRSFKLVVKNASILSSDYRKFYEDIFAGLDRLPLNGVEVSVDIVDKATGRTFAWRR